MWIFSENQEKLTGAPLDGNILIPSLNDDCNFTVKMLPV